MKAFLLLAFLAVAPDGWIRGALNLSGVSSEEELTSAEIERYSSLYSRPIDLNASSRAALESCGLFSQYQISVLLDARSSGGDILSYTELSSLDGFSPEFVEDLRHFVTLGKPELSVMQPTDRLSAVGFVRAVSKDGGFSLSGKLSASYSEAFRASFCLSGGSFSGFSFAWSSERARLSLTVGDYYARFGQGLVLWTGFSLSGVSSPASLKRSAYGINPCNSFSPDSHMRGAAISYAPGRWRFCASYDIGGSFALNTSFRTGISTFGLTFLASNESLCAGVDAVSTLGCFTLFGEAALDLRSATPAAVAGACWNIGYRKSLSAAFRYYPYGFISGFSSPLKTFSSPRGESGFSAGWKCNSVEATLDFASNREKAKSSLKSVVLYHPEFSVGKFVITPYFKAAARYRPQDKSPLRMEMRCECSAAFGNFSAGLRADLVRCCNPAWNVCADIGYKGAFTLLLRASLFKVDNWDDRIYVYERDVAGSFNVPARYGRGFSLSAYGSYSCFSFRFGTVRYPWTEGRQPGLEFKLQWNFDSQKVKRRPSPRAGACEEEKAN